MDSVSGTAAYVTIGLYGALVIYVALVGWRTPRDGRMIRLVWFLTLPIVVFIALWLSGNGVWELVLFMFVLGADNRLPFASKWTAAIFALLIATLVFVRLLVGRAGRRWRVRMLFGSLTLLGLLGSIYSYEIVRSIDGWTAQSVAEKSFSVLPPRTELFIDPGAKRQIVQEDKPAETTHLKSSKRFVLYYGRSPIREVYVAPYYWWWKYVGAKTLHPNLSDLEEAKTQWDRNRQETRAALEAIIRDYPNTEASRRAESILQELRAR